MKRLFSILSIFIFLVIVYLFFIKPKFDSKKASLAAEVVSIVKMKRSGGYKIMLEENGKTKYLFYSFLDDNFDIEIGDSMFKKSTSNDLFVKEKKSGILRLANDQEVLITY